MKRLKDIIEANRLLTFKQGVAPLKKLRPKKFDVTFNGKKIGHVASKWTEHGTRWSAHHDETKLYSPQYKSKFEAVAGLRLHHVSYNPVK